MQFIRVKQLVIVFLTSAVELDCYNNRGEVTLWLQKINFFGFLIKNGG